MTAYEMRNYFLQNTLIPYIQQDMAEVAKMSDARLIEKFEEYGLVAPTANLTSSQKRAYLRLNLKDSMRRRILSARLEIAESPVFIEA